MYSTKPLFKIIKIQSVVLAVIFGARTAGAFYALLGGTLKGIIFSATLPVTLFVGLTFGLIMAWLTSDIWATKGMLAMNYMVSLILSDVLSLFIWAVLLGGNRQSLFFALWIDGAFSAIFMLLLMAYGYHNERTVVRHSFSCHTLKLKRQYRIAFLSDIHYATIQPEEILAQTVDRINEEQPDMVLLAGDIAEEATPGEKLPELFEQLGRLKSRYGTFFVHGNHDRQEKLHGEGRTYTDEEFDSLMKDAGIQCIDDELRMPGGGICLQGRKDYSYEDRLTADEIAAGIDRDKFTIVMEHQPAECEELAQAGVDLCLAGHFHGAQNWTNNIVYRLAGMYYDGLYKVGGMQLYVNAGLTGSKYPVRTHSHCEYVIIDLKNELKVPDAFDSKGEK